MPIPFEFDFKKPDYIKVYEWRINKLLSIRRNQKKLSHLKAYYKENPAQFIIDWGITYDPRNVERGLPANCPFLLFPKQEEWINWFIGLWKNRKPGLTEKSRELGLSWLTVALAATMCLFYDGLSIGFGSRKQEYVDKLGDPKSLLQKVRFFMNYIPKEFRGEWDISKHAPHMKIHYPETGSIISGESGDGIGRGDRTSFYIIDESAWLPHPELIDASLSQTTNCRVDISTPHGMNNPFARKRHSGNISVFTFAWRDDPRKDQEWYLEKCKDIDDPVVIAQELDLSYSASMEGVLIPSAWIQAAIDSHKKLNIQPTGINTAGLDIADQGKDKNALSCRKGILLYFLEEWSGENEDIFKTVEKCFRFCDFHGITNVTYDGDGLGAGVRGDARVINEKRVATGRQPILFEQFRGSGEVIDGSREYLEYFTNIKPEGKSRTNEDFFANAKAQAWWDLRYRFQETYRAINGKKDFNPDNIISISSDIKNLNKLISELSQPTYGENTVGKLLVNKIPDGGISPNMADSVMIAFSRKKRSTGFWS